jgi:inorganic pyrophosphatase
MGRMKNKTAQFTQIGAFDSDGDKINVIVDTPRGSRNKFKYDEGSRLFKLGGVLPAGASFPFDFGFVPATQGEDGDPLDVLLLMDEPTFVGCLVSARLIGVIKAEQTEDGKTTRNDRLIAVAAESRNHREVRALKQLSENLLEEIEHFFVSYNQAKGKEFKPLGRFGPEQAAALLKAGLKGVRAKKKTK